MKKMLHLNKKTVNAFCAFTTSFVMCHLTHFVM